jgi:hypothetical protein
MFRGELRGTHVVDAAEGPRVRLAPVSLRSAALGVLVLVAVAALSASLAAVDGSAPLPRPVAATPSPCHPGQLAISGATAPGAALSGGVIVIYEDTSSDACTLSGYPRVIGVTATHGTEVIAHDEPAGELGGLGGRASKDRAPRAVVLHERGAVASSLVEFASIGTLQTVSLRCIGVGLHPMGIDELRVVVDGGKPRVVHVPATLVVCNALSANPYVPGEKGRWNPTVPHHAS